MAKRREYGSPLVKADEATFVVKAEKDGKLRIQYKNWTGTQAHPPDGASTCAIESGQFLAGISQEAP